MRIAGERHCDHRALAQTAAELERIRIDAVLGVRHANLAQQPDGLLPRLRRAQLARVDADCLDDLVADRVVSAERRHRLLKNKSDFLAPNGADGAAGRIELRELDGCAVGGAIDDLAADDPAGPVHDTQDRARRDALATAALAHEPERPAGEHVEARAVDSLDDAFILEKVCLEVLHREDRELRCHKGLRHRAVHRRGN